MPSPSKPFKPAQPFKPGVSEINSRAAVKLPEEFSVEVVESKDGGRTQTSGFVELKGEGATPTKRVEIHYLHAPGKPTNYPSASITNADGHGHFEVRDEWNLINGTTEDANVDVNVIARDVTTGHFAVTSLKASRWVSF
jgi:hypothetical protein